MSNAHHSLSSADTAWLHMDRPTNLMVINSILLFDEQLDWERLEQVICTRLVEPYPRFRERVAESRLAVGGAHWETDPNFELARHLHRLGLPAPADQSSLQELAGDLASIPLDRGKPLWEMYFVDGPGQGCAVIVRMHHCIADGIALAQVLLSLTDAAAEGEPRSEPAHEPERRRSTLRAIAQAPLDTLSDTAATAIAPITGTIGATRRLSATLVREGAHTLAHPRHAPELADALLAEVRATRKLLFTPRDSRSALKRELGTQRSVAWSRPLSLARVKAIAHAQGATVNDVLLAAVSGALRGYLIEQGETPHEIRTLVPVNLRPLERLAPDALGNLFGLVFLTLPVDRSSRRQRLSELNRRMNAIKHSAEGPVSYAMLEAAGLTPPEVERWIIDFFTAKATAVMTNVPGPRETVYLAGSPLRTVLVWAPTAGSVGMSVSIFSYDGRITVGLLVHAATVPDPRAIVRRLHREIAAMARLAPDERAERSPNRQSA